MPQKRNPVPLEHLRLKFSLAAGGADQIVQTMHNTPFADMNDLNKKPRPPVMMSLSGLIMPFPYLEVCRSDEDQSDLDREPYTKIMATITELADTLVRAEGIGFRAAHQVASKLSREALSNGFGFNELPWDLFARTFEELVGRPPQVKREVLMSAVSPKNFIAVRETPGGPGPHVLSEALAGYKDRLASLNAGAEDMRKRISQANALRNRLVSDIIAGGGVVDGRSQA